jgi:hypothetical protein
MGPATVEGRQRKAFRICIWCDFHPKDQGATSTLILYKHFFTAKRNPHYPNIS